MQEKKPAAMDTLAKKLQTLHEKTTEGSNYEEAVTWFLMHLAPLPELTKASKPVAGDPFLAKALETSLRTMYENAVKEKALRHGTTSIAVNAEIYLSHVRAHKFYHGSVNLKDGMGVTFYFEESRIGVLFMSFDFSPKVWVSRYSGLEIEKDGAIQYGNKDKQVN